MRGEEGRRERKMEGGVRSSCQVWEGLCGTLSTNVI